MKARCILYVEDDENDVYLMQHLFKKAGVSDPLLTVTNGDMAIDYLGGNNAFADREQYPLPSLVLLDLKLPCRDGFEVLRWIREQPGLKRLVVIVLTSSASPTDINRAYDLGANSYIEKPASFDQAAQMVQHLKGWWLGFNRFALIELPAQPVPSV